MSYRRPLLYATPSTATTCLAQLNIRPLDALRFRALIRERRSVSPLIALPFYSSPQAYDYLSSPNASKFQDDATMMSHADERADTRAAIMSE